MQTNFKNGLTELTLIENDIEVGEMKVDFTGDNAFIFSIMSHKKGCGTKMVDYLKSIDGIKTISGDVAEGTEFFWFKMGSIIVNDEFEIRI